MDDLEWTHHSSSSGEESDVEEKRSHYVKVGKSLLRREEVNPKYKGKTVSRSQLDETDSEEGDLLQSESSEESEEEAAFNNEEMDGDIAFNSDEDEQYMGQLDQESQQGSEQDSEVNSEGDEDDMPGVDSEGDSEQDEDEMPEGDYDEQDFANELKAFKQDEGQLVQKLSQSAKSDIEKGKHVKNQIKEWNLLLEARIHMQKAVAAANLLPDKNVHDETYPQAIQLILDTLKTLVDVRLHLHEQSGIHVPEAKEIRKRKWQEMNEDDIFQILSSLETCYTDYRNESLEKWSQRVQLANTQKFKVINQSTLTQIQNVLGDQERLLKRTQLNRSEVKRPGASTAEKHDPEIFDDTDFYQQQLKEFIESRISSDDPMYAAIHTQMMKQQKHKKVVDTKASKGRKIRFHTHEKLMNFMAVEPRMTWHQEMIDQLFASLFGVSAPAPEQRIDDGFKLF